jgi:23S rRNA-/tRNA-specific pseudouridylate synthase
MSLLEKQTQSKLFGIHRLDRQTSGVLLVAKNSRTASLMGQVMQDHQIKKCYLALVRGSLSQFFSDRPLTSESGAKKECYTAFKAIKSFNEGVSLIEASPLTGRMHQIRRHLAHLANHIIGDTKYGKGGINREFRETFQNSRMFLHASRLEIQAGPYRGFTFQCELPSELALVLEKLSAD